MIAVILAAGKGSRLGDYTEDRPKSLLPLNSDNLTLLDYNLEILLQLNLEKIKIVTGFNSEKIERHVIKHDNVEIIYNPFWDSCNVLGSLYMAIDKIEDNFLFLHADTLADKAIWQMMIREDGDMVLPFQRKKCGEEEMKVLLKNGKLIQISKLLNAEEAEGEFLGIAKFSKETLTYFKKKSEEFFKRGELNQYMESIIQAAVDDKKFDIRPMDILEHNFVEVDFEDDYLRAKAEFGDTE